MIAIIFYWLLLNYLISVVPSENKSRLKFSSANVFFYFCLYSLPSLLSPRVIARIFAGVQNPNQPFYLLPYFEIGDVESVNLAKIQVMVTIRWQKIEEDRRTHQPVAADSACEASLHAQISDSIPIEAIEHSGNELD